MAAGDSNFFARFLRIICYDRLAVVATQFSRQVLRFVSHMHAVRGFPVRPTRHTMSHLLCSLTKKCCVVAVQHEATTLFRLRELTEEGIVPGLVAYGPALGGALYYLASTIVVGGRPFPPEPSWYAP